MNMTIKKIGKHCFFAVLMAVSATPSQGSRYAVLGELMEAEESVAEGAVQQGPISYSKEEFEALKDSPLSQEPLPDETIETFLRLGIYAGPETPRVHALRRKFFTNGLSRLITPGDFKRLPKSSAFAGKKGRASDDDDWRATKAKRQGELVAAQQAQAQAQEKAVPKSKAKRRKRGGKKHKRKTKVIRAGEGDPKPQGKSRKKYRYQKGEKKGWSKKN